VISGQKVLAVVPARGGSRGVPRKNIRDVGGKPLIVWTIEVARASRYVDRVITSSDDDEIISVARAFGCDVPFKRPSELADDKAPGIAPVMHAMENLTGYDIVVLLQPTSPLRTVEDVDLCLEQLLRSGAPSCVSVCEAECHPYIAFERLSDGTLRSFISDRQVTNLRRQDFPLALRLNGAVYAARIPWLRNSRTFITTETTGYLMPTERSLDIDTLEDLSKADAYLSDVRQQRELETKS